MFWYCVVLGWGGGQGSFRGWGVEMTVYKTLGGDARTRGSGKPFCGLRLQGFLLKGE